MEIPQVVKCLSALAQESRLRVFRLLVRAGREGIAAGELAEQLGIPNATLSFHLKELTNSGLITQRRDGRSIIYAMEPERLSEFIEYLTEDCCMGKPEDCVPKSSPTKSSCDQGTQ